MKNLFILFLPLCLFFSCQNAEKTTSSTADLTTKTNTKTVKISGTIENPVSETASIRAGENTHEAKVADGKFVLEFELDQPQTVTFSHGNERGTLYLEPSDDVTLTLNPEQFDETLKLGGKGAEESNYLLAKYLLNEKYDEQAEEIYTLSPTDFAAKVDAIKAENEAHLAKYVKAHNNMNADFLKNEKASIRYKWASDKINYPSYFEYFAKKKAPDLGDDYYAFMEKIDLSNEADFENNSAYARLVKSYLNSQTEGAGKGVAPLASMFEIVNKKIKSNKIKEGILYSTLSSFISFNDVAGVKKYLDEYNSFSTNDENKEKIAELYAIALVLQKGKPAPNFTYQNVKGEMVSLESLKGKNVYVDVWATWCGPCKREIPHLKKLEEQFHNNNNIAFVSVSIDKLEDTDKWLKMVEDKELSGIQLMADKAWKSSICKDYAINGIPRFLLIDKNGNIFDKDAPRPSSKEIKEILLTMDNSRH